MSYNSSIDYPEFRINAHGHLLPDPEQFPAFMRKHEVLWISADRQYMCQKNWKRPITDPSFFLEDKLKWMDRNNIDHEVVLVLSQLYSNGLEPGLARDVIRFQNDFNAGLQHDYPEKFTGGFLWALRSIKRPT